MNWHPFTIESEANPKQPLRSWKTLDGMGDRMRIAAFAELQAIHAFTWAAEAFAEVPGELRSAWREQIPEEKLHHELIMNRMGELGVAVDERPVSDRLYRALRQCESGRDFCLQIVAEEYRGLLAARKLVEIIAPSDPETAAVFERIADDEVSHVKLAERFYDWRP